MGEITVSSDGRLLGILQHANTQSTLHIWNLTSSGFTKVDLIKINLSCPAKLNLSRPTLHALGHTYFIVALQSPLNNLKYTHDNAIKIVVLSTYTGETIWEYTMQIKNVTSYTTSNNTTLLAAPQPEVECLAVIKEQWLSDIHTVSSSMWSSQTLHNFVMVDKPFMAFALIFKLITLMLYFVCLVLYCTLMSVPLKRKFYCFLQLFDEEILVLTRLDVLAMANFIHCMT